MHPCPVSAAAPVAPRSNRLRSRCLDVSGKGSLDRPMLHRSSRREGDPGNPDGPDGPDDPSVDDQEPSAVRIRLRLADSLRPPAALTFSMCLAIASTVSRVLSTDLPANSEDPNAFILT